jgi:hypothetical protein
MIVCIQGNQGDGKTATLAFLAWWFFKKGHKIHANFWLEIPGLEYHYVTAMNDIEKIYKGYFLADEFWSWADSHKSFGDVEEAVASIIMKARKRGYNLIYESKRIHFTNRRIRELTDFVLEPHLYFNNNGSLERIEQDLLEPVDLEPYLNDLWVMVKKYRVLGQKMIEMDDGRPILFKLSEIADKYDTREEIDSLADGEKHAGLEKGIRKENKLTKYIRTLWPDAEILHNHNSWGWDARVNLLAFDCVSCTMRTTTKRPYIDVRGKKIKELLLDARKEKRAPFWAWHFQDKWYCMPMVKEHIDRSILKTSEGYPVKELIETTKKADTWIKEARIEHKARIEKTAYKKK